MYTPYSSPTAGTVNNSGRPESRETSIGVRDIFEFGRRYATSILLFVAMFAAAAALYVIVTPPIFTATASVIIDTNRPTGVLNEGGRADLMTDQARVENQIEIIKSDRIAAEVILKFALDQNPEFVRQSSGISSMLQRWMSYVVSGPEDEEAARRRAESVRQRLVAIRFAERLAIRRVGQSLVVEVAFSSRSADTAAEIVNAVAEAYVRESVATKSELARRRSEWLSERLDALQKQSFDAARAVERFKLVGEAGPNADVRAKLAELESVSQSYRRMYDAFLQQYTETLQRVTYPEPDAQIVSQAAVPLRKNYPKEALTIGFALLLGAATGIAYALMRAVTDRSLRSPRQLTGEIGADYLGAVSDFRAPSPKRSMRRPLRAGESGETTLLTRTGICEPKSPISTDLRTLRASINALTIQQRSRCFGIVSPTNGEGATTVAAGLAHLYAFSGSRVLLIDACSCNPRLSRELATAADVGLLQAFDDAEVCAQVLAHQSNLPFALLPLGSVESGITAGDRIGSERAAIQIDDFKDQYDLVLFDLPALSASPDARAIAPYLDGVILVVDAGRTSLDTIASAIAELSATRANVLGVVVNKVQPTARRQWTW